MWNAEVPKVIGITWGEGCGRPPWEMTIPRVAGLEPHTPKWLGVVQCPGDPVGLSRSALGWGLVSSDQERISVRLLGRCLESCLI